MFIFTLYICTASSLIHKYSDKQSLWSSYFYFDGRIEVLGSLIFICYSCSSFQFYSIGFLLEKFDGDTSPRYVRHLHMERYVLIWRNIQTNWVVPSPLSLCRCTTSSCTVCTVSLCCTTLSTLTLLQHLQVFTLFPVSHLTENDPNLLSRILTEL